MMRGLGEGVSSGPRASRPCVFGLWLSITHSSALGAQNAREGTFVLAVQPRASGLTQWGRFHSGRCAPALGAGVLRSTAV